MQHTETGPPSPPARLLIVGPQGSGKGTQGSLISEKYGIPLISTGEVFRGNIDGGTELGKRVQAIVEAGDLVPDELTGAIVRDRIADDDAMNGFLLDGYPRNVQQVADLDRFLAGCGAQIAAVIALCVPHEDIIARVRQRAHEQGRADDTEQGIAHRLAVYARETAPILDVYRGRGILDEIDGVGPVELISNRVSAALGARGIVPALVSEG